MNDTKITIHKAILASSLPKSIKLSYIVDRDAADIIITRDMVQVALECWKDHEDVMEELMKVAVILDDAQATMIVLDDREVTLQGVEGFYHRFN